MPEPPKFTSKAYPSDRRNRYAEIQYADDAGSTVKRTFSYFSGEKLKLLGIFTIIAAGTVFGVIAPLFQSKAVDIIAGNIEDNFIETVLMMLAVYLLYSMCQLLQGLLSAVLGQRLVKKIREELFSKIISLPVRYMDTHSHGDVMSRMTNDIDNISITVSQSLPSLFSGSLTILVTSIVMLILCPELAILSFITIVMTAAAAKFLSVQIRKYSRRKQAILGKLNGCVEETMAGYRTVVACDHQEIATEQFCEMSDSLTKAGIMADIFGGVMGPVMNCIGNVSFVIIAAFGGYFALNGMISVGVISAFIVYAKQFSRPINEIAQVYGQLQTAIAGAERVFRVLDEADEDMSGKHLLGDGIGNSIGDGIENNIGENEAALQENPAASVTFENVDFSYEEGFPVLRNFSLEIPSGKKVALVGSTGSGKTTVVNLLMRFYDADSGNILINGQPVSEISRASLRRNVAIVLQDTVLFSDTILNNLRYGNENADDEEIEKAIDVGCCREMIDALPDGKQTVLTGAGSNISQGQRQLLAIARAFAADPKILILDEATSNVDTRTEKFIQDAMARAMKDRTGIIIAHRLSTIRNADMIVVMDNGRIAESGTHESLLAQKGKYYELYMTQYAGFET